MKKPGPSEFVASLGNTSEEVAQSLIKLGVRVKHGVRPVDYNCPLAIAINEHANGWGGIRVTKSGHLTYNDCQIIDPKTTPAAIQFVKDFDAGKYPELWW